MNVENIAKPMISVVTFVAAISRRANVARSTSGSGTRCSITTQSVNMTADAASRPSTPADVQPQLLPSLIAISSVPSATDSVAPPM